MSPWRRSPQDGQTKHTPAPQLEAERKIRGMGRSVVVFFAFFLLWTLTGVEFLLFYGRGLFLRLRCFCVWLLYGSQRETSHFGEGSSEIRAPPYVFKKGPITWSARGTLRSIHGSNNSSRKDYLQPGVVSTRQLEKLFASAPVWGSPLSTSVVGKRVLMGDRQPCCFKSSPALPGN